jgi:hypothetical protein
MRSAQRFEAGREAKTLVRFFRNLDQGKLSGVVGVGRVYGSTAARLACGCDGGAEPVDQESLRQRPSQASYSGHELLIGLCARPRRS